MPGLDKHPTAARITALGKAEPVTTLLTEPISTQASEEHIVRALVLGMEFEPIALEALDRNRLAVDANLLLWPNREPKDRKSTVLLPKFGYPTIHTLICLDKAALGGCRSLGGLETNNRKQHDTHYNQAHVHRVSSRTNALPYAIVLQDHICGFM
jgi:hypothetical protein